jgi:hypothetical protein
VSRGLSLKPNYHADFVILSRDRLDQIWTSLDAARNSATTGCLSDAEEAVENARALVSDAIDGGEAARAVSTAAAAAQVRLAYQNGMAARSLGRRANPFEDVYGMDWPGRSSCADAWSRGRDDWEAVREFGRDGHPPKSPVREVRLGESRDHRRRVLEHQERVAAEQREAAAHPKDPQLRIPLIGEVRRPEPSPPKRRRPRMTRSVQPGLGES